MPQTSTVAYTIISSTTPLLYTFAVTWVMWRHRSKCDVTWVAVAPTGDSALLSLKFELCRGAQSSDIYSCMLSFPPLLLLDHLFLSSFHLFLTLANLRWRQCMCVDIASMRLWFELKRLWIVARAFAFLFACPLATWRARVMSSCWWWWHRCNRHILTQSRRPISSLFTVALEVSLSSFASSLPHHHLICVQHPWNKGNRKKKKQKKKKRSEDRSWTSQEEHRQVNSFPSPISFSRAHVNLSRSSACGQETLKQYC